MTCCAECKRCGRPIADVVSTEGIVDDFGNVFGKIVDETGNTVNNVAKSVTDVAESVKNATEENLMAVFDKMGDIAAGNNYRTRMGAILNQYNQVTIDYIKNRDKRAYDSRKRQILEKIERLAMEMSKAPHTSDERRKKLCAIWIKRLNDMAEKNKKMIMAR